MEITISRCGSWLLVRITEDGESVSALIPRPKGRAPRAANAAWPKAPKPHVSAPTSSDEPWTALLRALQGGR